MTARDLLPGPGDHDLRGPVPRADLLAGITAGVVALPLALAFDVSSGADPRRGWSRQSWPGSWPPSSAAHRSRCPGRPARWPSSSPSSSPCTGRLRSPWSRSSAAWSCSSPEPHGWAGRVPPLARRRGLHARDRLRHLPAAGPRGRRHDRAGGEEPAPGRGRRRRPVTGGGTAVRTIATVALVAASMLLLPKLRRRIPASLLAVAAATTAAELVHAPSPESANRPAH